MAPGASPRTMAAFATANTAAGSASAKALRRDNHVDARRLVRAIQAGADAPVQVRGERGLGLLNTRDGGPDAAGHIDARLLRGSPRPAIPAAQANRAAELGDQGIDFGLNPPDPLLVAVGLGFIHVLAELLEAPPVGGLGGCVEHLPG